MDSTKWLVKCILKYFLIPSFILIIPLTVFANSQNDITLFTYKENYQLQKFEPEKGIYLGGYVLQDEYLEYDMREFNSVTNKDHASFFMYVGYGKPFPKKWVEEVIEAGAFPNIALEPNDGLEFVQDDEYLREFARAAGEYDVPIFLRYASEMNGDWAAYSNNPEEYIEKWKLVYNVMKEEAPNVIMLWAVFTFPESTILDYYPGDEYVDWVGVNIYNVAYHNDSLNHPAHHEDPLDLLNYVYNTFSHKKPIQISEYGVTHYTRTDGKDYTDFSIEKLTRLYGNLPEIYPRVKAIYYFNVNTFLNAPIGRRINDYALTNNPDKLNAYSELIQDDRYLTTYESIDEDNDGIVREKLSYRGYLFKEGGHVYADIEFFDNYLDLNILISDEYAVISNGNIELKYEINNKPVPKGFYNQYKNVRGLPVRKVSQDFGYNVTYNPNNNSVLIEK